MKKSERGYDIEQVEEFLQNAREAFEQHDADRVSAESIRTVAFAFAKGGYVIAQVDAALDRLEDAFAAREKERVLAEQGKDGLYAAVRSHATEILERLRRGRKKRFRRAGWLRQGYHRKQVDDFAERLIGYFESREQLTVAEVRTATFAAQSNGYSEAQVDAVLDAVVDVMLTVR